MPPIGTELNTTTSFGQSPAGRAFTINGLGNAAPTKTIETALTFDQPTVFGIEQAGTVNPALINAFGLSDWQQQAWRLKRIVGKAFIGASLDDIQATGPLGVLVSVGFIVRRVDVEADAPVISVADQAVDSVQNHQDPWIWRRQWLLSTSFTGGLSGDGDVVNQFPRTNANYGSVMDGPHIDQKTNRVIGPEEQLILNITATVQPLPDTITSAPVGHVYGYVDVRLLGSIMKATNRRNASR